MHNTTHALVVLSCALLCVSDAMQHHAMEALHRSKQFQVAINQCCSACRGMAACMFCAQVLEAQYYSCVDRAVMRTALRFRCHAASCYGGIATQQTVSGRNQSQLQCLQRYGGMYVLSSGA